ncbi:SLC13 family permease [Sulfurovum sp.]|jgi:sodium-dependent dicarboxylate transporter 2/3/5|uniref:SLC13 family permease n=1 Tax=Sulfurovum sp. TaxID=1969726 RepID=UPI002A36454E|nr:SLC13 family permease [Sulfurovum sp.]MDY0403159.1 SLC13 family permease [Sulfurovum sp.]
MRGIIIALLIGLLFFGLSSWVFTPQHSLLIGLVAFLVALWTNEALPLGAVSLLPIILFPLFGILDIDEVTPNYSKSIIFLFLGGFMLAIALEKINLHKYFSAKLLSFFPKTPRGIIYALSITSALLSGVLSNTTVTLMLMPIALFLSDNIKLKVRFLLGMAYGASIGGILTPIGTPPNLILLGFLEENDLPTLAFGEWMYMMTPIVAAMLLIIPWLLALGVDNESVSDVKQDVPQLNSEQRRLYWIIGILASILIANTFMKQIAGFALDEKLVLLGFGLLMFVPRIGFLTWEDTRNIPYEIIFLFGAGFSIAAAFTNTGLAADIATKLAFISSIPLFWMFVAVALVVTFSTEVTSNTALTSIAIPIFYEFSKMMPQSEGTLLLMVATVAASYAFMLPIATPPNAIVMSSRVIHIKEMATIGFKLNLIGVTVLSLIAYTLWRVML